jgi:transposase InsO family protein
MTFKRFPCASCNLWSSRSANRSSWNAGHPNHPLVGAKTVYITPGSPWENGFVESFNARLRDELLDGEISYSLAEAKIVIESWRRHYNTERPHGSLGYKPTAPEVFVPAMAARTAAQPHPSASRPPPTMASKPSMH